MNVLVYAIFFLSGAAALLFETLWFHQAGIAFGNSVWASSIVLSSFMIGLALGNGLAALWAPRLRRPLSAYGVLELIIALTGALLVWMLPAWGGLLAPWVAPYLDQSWLINPVRLMSGFLLLLIPATAMGATLPLLVGFLTARDSHFGSVLGRLYGWNTLGAMLGAVAGEFVLIQWLGIRGSALFAVGCNGLAALGAFALARNSPSVNVPDTPARSRLTAGPGLPIILAAALSGAILLAYEVVWFRFLELFVAATNAAFSVMLATVLAGIGVGGVLAGVWLRRRPGSEDFAPAVALAAGAIAVVCFAAFRFALDLLSVDVALTLTEVLYLTAALSLPVSIASGVLFTLLGSQLAAVISPATRATGVLTCANTIGAGLGSLCAGFVLLPQLGMEWSFCLLALLYAAVAFLSGLKPRASRVRWGAVGPFAAVFLVALVLFPFGTLREHYLVRAIDRVSPGENWSIEAVREGLTGTVVLLRKSFGQQTLSHQLMTNSFSMSGTAWKSRRYMGLYAWLPLAISPEPRKALLISYGVGNTALSLTEIESLEQLDIVDISKEIFDLSAILYPNPEDNPLEDPRVKVHVEDGRYFLQTTGERFDLITGEPPPPKYAGVVNLYTREYFELLRSRLVPGGINTYWLPVHDINEQDAKAIVRAYCDVFEDCSLWTGYGLDWMLVGSRNARGSRSGQEFSGPWQDPRVGKQLRAVGIELPEQMGALFLADADPLRAWVDDTPPLTDNYPRRLSSRRANDRDSKDAFHNWMDTDASRSRFEESPQIEATWPKEVREGTLPYFDFQWLANEWSTQGSLEGIPPRERYQLFDRLLVETSLRAPIPWFFDSTPDRVELARREAENGNPLTPVAREVVEVVVALTERDLPRGQRALGRLQRLRPENSSMFYARVTLLGRLGLGEEASEVARRASSWLPKEDRDREFWIWAEDEFGVESPIGESVPPQG